MLHGRWSARTGFTECERLLMQSQSPSVLTTAMLHALATSGRLDAPSSASFTRWVASLAVAGKLQEVIRGVYLNCLGHRELSPAAASHWVRARSVVSLAWVLEQAHITNNFGDTVTCIVPTEPGWPNPQIGDRKTVAGSFRFFAMPASLVDERAGQLKDIRDPRFDYPRTTPEKALMDWIFLGASPRSRMTRPPYDLDIAALSMPRLRRIAKAMDLVAGLGLWMEQYRAYQSDKDVQDNAASGLRL